MADIAQYPPGCIHANPDIAGIGVRIAIYAQNFIVLGWAFKAFLDRYITAEELIVTESQSGPILLMACALLMSALVEGATMGMSTYHAIIILNLALMNNTNTILYILLFKYQGQLPDDIRGKFIRQLETNDTAINPITFPYTHTIRRLLRRKRTLENVRTGNSSSPRIALTPVTPITPRPTHSSSRTSDGGGVTRSRWRGIYLRSDSLFFEAQELPIRKALPLIAVGTFHLTFVGAFGLWFWSTLESFGGSAQCTPVVSFSIVIVGQDIPVTSKALRLVSLMIYSTIVFIGILAAFVIYILSTCRQDSVNPKHNRSTASTSISRPGDGGSAVGPFARVPKITSGKLPAWPAYLILWVIASINIILTVDTEIMIKRVRVIVEDGESQWTFGQTLAIFLLILPIWDAMVSKQGDDPRLLIERKRLDNQNQEVIEYMGVQRATIVGEPRASTGIEHNHEHDPGG